MKNNKWLYVFLIMFLIISTFTIISNSNDSNDEFIKSYNAMTKSYNDVYLSTLNNDMSSVQYINDYKIKWNAFYALNRNNVIKPFSNDLNWSSDLDSIQKLVLKSDSYIHKNQLDNSNNELKKINDIWMNIFKRNKISVLPFRLFEFDNLLTNTKLLLDDKNYELVERNCNQMSDLWSDIINLSDTHISSYPTTRMVDEKEKLSLFCDDIHKGKLSNLNYEFDDVKDNFLSIYFKYKYSW